MSRPTERYPDPGVFDDALYQNLKVLPNLVSLDLHFLQNHIDKKIVNFHIPKENLIRGMQANMFIILTVNNDSTTTKYMAKRIVPKELPEKASEEIWREFVLSVRTEIDFYKELMLPANKEIRCLFPKVYYSDGTPKDLDDNPQETSFILIMEDLNTNYYQTAMMNDKQAYSVMASLAKLHAHYWKLNPANQRGGFWVLNKRLKHKEVENADTTWNQFLHRFPELQELHPEIKSIGRKIKERSAELEKFVEAGACTTIHGDAKGWNLFFSKEGSDVLLIDLQWTGRGHPFQDVAYALTTTLSAEELVNMDSFVDIYTDNLKMELERKGVKLDPKFRNSFDDVWLDYARVIVTGLWKNLNKESIERNKKKVGPSMINRSMHHVLYITKKIIKLLHL